MDHFLDIQQSRGLKASKKSKYLIGILLMLAGLTGIMPVSLQGVAIIGVAALTLFTGEIYLVYPIMLFYGNRFGILGGMSVYRLFTLLFLMISLLKGEGVKIQAKKLGVFLLFAIYCVVVVGAGNIRRGVFTVLDMACILLLIDGYLKAPDKLRNFFIVYVLCAFLAYFTGMQLDGLEYRDVVGGKYVTMVRNMATFEDPNYMGYFYTGAIFATVSLKLFSPKLRFLVVLALNAILLTSLSVTAIVVNIVLWMVYLVITRKINPKTLMVILLICALALGLYQYALNNPETPVVGGLSLRIAEKMEQLTIGNFGDATSGRSSLQEKHLEYFAAQPVYKMLIGMNAASTIKTDLGGMTQAAHNEYVDWLLNVGLIGTAVMLCYLVSGIWKLLQNCWRNANDLYSMGRLMVKMVWVCYACTLTLYGDYRFMLFFLL